MVNNFNSEQTNKGRKQKLQTKTSFSALVQALCTHSLQIAHITNICLLRLMEKFSWQKMH